MSNFARMFSSAVRNASSGAKRTRCFGVRKRCLFRFAYICSAPCRVRNTLKWNVLFMRPILMSRVRASECCPSTDSLYFHACAHAHSKYDFFLSRERARARVRDHVRCAPRHARTAWRTMAQKKMSTMNKKQMNDWRL